MGRAMFANALESLPGVTETTVRKVRGIETHLQMESLAVEEPLEIRVGFKEAGRRVHRAVSITMRTPGCDRELAAGFLWTEGLITSLDQIEAIRPCGVPNASGQRNLVRVDLRDDTTINLQILQRHSYVNSSCGICGKTSLDAVRICRRPAIALGHPLVEPGVIHRLPGKLRAAQANFDRTGGLHGAGLFDTRGELICLYEDVGRHNAVDKLIGARLLAGALPLANEILVLSGRISFELVQKAAMAGVAVVAAVGAASSLAVELARECGMTVIGFARDERFNIYAGQERITGMPNER
jgi:FdhD protein